jgi:hypothetical protein
MVSQVTVDGEDLAVVTRETADRLFSKRYAHGHALQWLADFGHYDELRLTVRRFGPLEICQPIVKIGEQWYRTHIERTLCDQCSHRVAAAAVGYYPDFAAGLSPEKAEALLRKALSLPILSCPKCGARYSRRGIVWFVDEKAPNQPPEPMPLKRPGSP